MAGRKASIRAMALTTVSMGTGYETLFQPSSAWVCARFRAGDATLPAAGQLAARSAFFAEPASAGTFTSGDGAVRRPDSPHGRVVPGGHPCRDRHSRRRAPMRFPGPAGVRAYDPRAGSTAPFPAYWAARRTRHWDPPWHGVRVPW